MFATDPHSSPSIRSSGKRLRLLINILIGAFLVYQSVIFGSTVLQLFGSGDITEGVVTPQPVLADAPLKRPDSEDLAGHHLFGEANIQTADSSESVIVSGTRLELTLRGIFSGDSADHSFAIIQDNRDGNERYFTIQQTVFGLATLEEIYHDRVLLQYNGRYETLRLPKEFLSGGDAYDSEAVRAEKRRIASNYRDRFLGGDGMDLIRLFGFEETYKNGGFAGFRVKALGKEGREMMAILGIEDGDLITVLNGKRFSDGLESFEEIKKLRTATSVDIIIERNGTEMPFHFEFEASMAEADAPQHRVEAGMGIVEQPAAPGTLLEAGGGVYAPEDTVSVPGNTSARNTPTDTEGDSDTTTKTGGVSYGDDDEDLGVDWDESPRAAEYKAMQQERSTGVSQDIEYDH